MKNVIRFHLTNFFELTDFDTIFENEDFKTLTNWKPLEFGSKKLFCPVSVAIFVLENQKVSLVKVPCFEKRERSNFHRWLL